MKINKKRKFIYKSCPVKHVLKDKKERRRSSNLVMQLNKDCWEVYKKISLSEEEFLIRETVFDQIKNCLENEFEKMGRKIVLEKFGSFYTKIMVYQSDIDVTVISKEKISENELLKDIKKVLMKKDLCKGEIIHIKKAKTPILKLSDKKYEIKVDIAVNKEDGIETGKFIKEKVSENRGIIPLLILVKYYLKRRRLNNTLFGGLNSYGQFLIVLNFVQLFPLANSADISKNLFVYLMEFFLYFSKFPFEKAKISCSSYKMNETGSVYVIDPIKENSNVTVNCTVIGIIQDLFNYNVKVMESVFNQNVDQNKNIIDLWFRIDEKELDLRKKEVERFLTK